MTTTKGATIIGHQGWADFFNQNALYYHYALQYQPLIILTTDQARQTFLENLFTDLSQIQVVVPNFHTDQTTLQTCVECHQLPSSKVCPRLKKTSRQPCRFVDYQSYPGLTHLKLGAFHKPLEWFQFSCSFSFAHKFYGYHNLPVSTRYEQFYLVRDLQLEQRRSDQLLADHQVTVGHYVVIHEDPDRQLTLNQGLISSQLPQINLNQLSSVFLDLIFFIDQAAEIHLIDSSYAVMIYLLSLKEQLFQNKIIYLHQIRKKRDYGIFQNPTLKNWRFV